MILVFWHAFLGWLWTALTERFTASSFVVGLVVAHLALRLSRGERARIRKTGLALRFLAFFAKEVVVSAGRVARDVLTPRPRMRPAIVGVPLDVRTDGQITLLAILITLTPGTLALDVSPDRRMLVVHAMFAADADRVRHEIKAGFERRILELCR
jgi:multicomponent Na+:H+ antiporter subunit E